jgi:hypothetical protein
MVLIQLPRDWYAHMKDGDSPAWTTKFHPDVDWIKAEHSHFDRSSTRCPVAGDCVDAAVPGGSQGSARPGR